MSSWSPANINTDSTGNQKIQKPLHNFGFFSRMTKTQKMVKQMRSRGKTGRSTPIVCVYLTLLLDFYLLFDFCLVRLPATKFCAICYLKRFYFQPLVGDNSASTFHQDTVSAEDFTGDVLGFADEVPGEE